MILALKYIWVTLKLLGQTDLPRIKVFSAKFSRILKLRVLRRWFFTDLDDAAWALLSGDAGGEMKIAVTRGGTLGDKIGLMLFLIGVRERFPGAKILFFDWDINAKYFDMFRDQHLIDGFYYSTGVIVNDLTQLALDRGLVDLCFDNRYVVKVSAGKNSRAPAEFVAEARAAFRRFETNFTQFPRDNDQLSRRFPDHSNFDIMSETSLIPIDVDGFRLPLFAADEGPRRAIRAEKYVIIHHGAGPTAWGHVARQTKMWFMERWAEVVTELRGRGYEVFQLGVAGEQVIPGASDQFLGKTTFHESCAILRDAAFLLDTEGGLVHMAAIVGARSVVLFGPTPSKFFGYARNVNIQLGEFRNCWWSHDKWQTVCKQTHDVPACMNRITAADVLRAVDELTSSPSTETQSTNASMRRTSSDDRARTAAKTST